MRSPTAAPTSAARADRSALTCRRSTAVLAQGSISSQGLSVRPGFLGLGLRGRYPPSPVPVQGCTSHPGHGAGRHDAQAARERTANPPAGTAPRPTFQLASERRPLSERDFAPVRSLAALSTTNEIAPGAFVSDGKHAAFRGPPLILRRRLATGATSARVTRKDSLTRRKRPTASPARSRSHDENIQARRSRLHGFACIASVASFTASGGDA
jgi:hypothetical protein